MNAMGAHCQRYIGTIIDEQPRCRSAQNFPRHFCQPPYRQTRLPNLDDVNSHR